MDSASIIEAISGLNKNEINSITLKTSAKRSAYWDIRIYALYSEFRLAFDKICEIDSKIESMTDSMRDDNREQSKINLSKFDTAQDHVIMLILSRQSSGTYTWEIKAYFANNEEEDSLSVISELHNKFQERFT